tara:strand:+ start:1001 stop:1402 length:402 start_codon:yes stop_codon:yes gene_type:complete
MKVSEQLILRAERFSDYVKKIIELGNSSDPEFKTRILSLEILGADFPKTLSLMKGMAAYHFWNLGGKDQELDEAYNCIEAYLIEDAERGFDQVLNGPDGDKWAVILASEAKEYGIITEEEYKRIFTEDPSEEK